MRTDILDQFISINFRNLCLRSIKHIIYTTKLVNIREKWKLFFCVPKRINLSKTNLGEITGRIYCLMNSKTGEKKRIFKHNSFTLLLV